jgi:hypothetical protein
MKRFPPDSHIPDDLGELLVEKRYTTAAVARMFMVSGETVRMWIRQGIMHAEVGPTGRYVVHESEIRRLMTKKYSGGATEGETQ